MGMDIKIVEDPEVAMDKAMYGLMKVFSVSLVISAFNGYNHAMCEIEQAMNNLVGSGLHAEIEIVRKGGNLNGVVRIFKCEEDLIRWQEDQPLRDVAERQPEKHW